MKKSNSVKFLTITILAILFGCQEKAQNLDPKETTQFSQGTIRTFAGSGAEGSTNGLGTQASFNNNKGIALDKDGNLFVSDYNNHRISTAGVGDPAFVPNHQIRKILPSGEVTSFVGGVMGSEDGTGSKASFNSPVALATDLLGNIFVADFYNHKIRKVSPEGVVTTLVGTGEPGDKDGDVKVAQLNSPCSIAVGPDGAVYFGEQRNLKIRKITPSGQVLTLAGTGINGTQDGPGAQATLGYPRGIVLDSKGNLYFSDYSNHRIRKITQDGVVSTFAGLSKSFLDGLGEAAGFSRPNGLAIDSQDNIYVADDGNNRVRKITPQGMVTTIAGSSDFGFQDGELANAKLNHPIAVAVDSGGRIYVSDIDNNRIRLIELRGK